MDPNRYGPHHMDPNRHAPHHMDPNTNFRDQNKCVTCGSNSMEFNPKLINYHSIKQSENMSWHTSYRGHCTSKSTMPLILPGLQNEPLSGWVNRCEWQVDTELLLPDNSHIAINRQDTRPTRVWPGMRQTNKVNISRLEDWPLTVTSMHSIVSFNSMRVNPLR